MISGVEKIKKPDPRIFQILLIRNNLQAVECIFIDDVEKNILAARSLGMTAIHCQSPEQTKIDLQKILNLKF